MTKNLSYSPYLKFRQVKTPADRDTAIYAKLHQERESREMTGILSPSPWAGRQEDVRENPELTYSAALARIAELEAALEPFKREAERYDRLVLGEDIDDWKLTTSELTLGDIRRALAALRNR